MSGLPGRLVGNEIFIDARQNVVAVLDAAAALEPVLPPGLEWQSRSDEGDAYLVPPTPAELGGCLGDAQSKVDRGAGRETEATIIAGKDRAQYDRLQWEQQRPMIGSLPLKPCMTGWIHWNAKAATTASRLHI